MSNKLTEAFIEHVWSLIVYWEHAPDGASLRRKLEGLAFSILVAIDGEAVALPPFSLCPTDDKSTDIAGELHELFYEYGRRLGHVS